MAWIGNINSKKVEIHNWQDLNLNFETTSTGVNTSFTSSFQPEFIKGSTRNAKDSFNVLQEALISTKYPSKIPFPIISTNDGTEIKGSLIPYASGNEFGDTNPDIIKMLWEFDKVNFFEQAQSLSLSTFLSKSDYETVRYIREGVPDYIDDLFITLAGVIIGIQVADQIREFSRAKADLIILLTAEPEKAISAAGPTSAGLPSFTQAAIKITLDFILQAAYLVLLLIVLNDLLKALSEAIFQKPRKYYWLNVKNVFEKGCAALGLQFSSSFFNGVYKDLNFLEATSKQGTLKSAPSNNPIPQQNFSDFVTTWANFFNGKIRVTTSGVMKLESDIDFKSEPPVPGLRLQKNYDTPFYDLNTDELINRFTYKYATATTDNHYDREAVEVTYVHNTININDFGISGNLDVSVPFTIAKRKGRTATAAKNFNKIFDLFSGLSGRYKIIGGDREGYILLQYDQVPVTLIALRSGGEKIKANQEQFLSATHMYETFYKPSIAPWNNQYKRYKAATDQPHFNTEDLLKLVNNPNMVDDNGKEITITRSSYDEDRGLSGFEYRREVKAGEFGYIDEKDFTEKINTK